MLGTRGRYTHRDAARTGMLHAQRCRTHKDAALTGMLHAERCRKHRDAARTAAVLQARRKGTLVAASVT